MKPKQKNFVCFGLIRCLEPISKQLKQTELFRNKPKQPKIFRKISKYALCQTVSVGLLFVWFNQNIETFCFGIETKQPKQTDWKQTKQP